MFPDAIVEFNGINYDVEFEYLSSNFIQHCHPVDFGGLCVCWRKDIEIPKVKTISLETLLREISQDESGLDSLKHKVAELIGTLFKK